MLFVHACYFLAQNGPVDTVAFFEKFLPYLRDNNVLYPEDEKKTGSRPGRQHQEKIAQIIRNLTGSHGSITNSTFIEERDGKYHLRADCLPFFRSESGGTKPLTKEHIKDYGPARTIGENRIIFGAPGTGKSFHLNSLWPRAIRTIFHNDYSNADFIGVYKPVGKTGDGGGSTGTIEYKFVPGPFIVALTTAYNNPIRHIALIIEEINRGNAAAIFGEVLQMLDRAPDGKGIYGVTPDPSLMSYLSGVVKDPSNLPDDRMFLPSNMSIIATMNSSDQGVEPLDMAFKRRWTFQYVPIDFETCTLASEKITYRRNQYTWKQFACAINHVLRGKVPEDRLIGPYFLKEGEHGLQEIVSGKLLFYLYHDLLRYREEDVDLFAGGIATFQELDDAYRGGHATFSKAVHDELDRLTGDQTASPLQAVVTK